MTPSNPFHENWGVNFAEKAYTTVEVKQMLWSMGVSTEVWMEGNKMYGGGMVVQGNGGIKPYGEKAIETIRNTLPKEARSFVQLDANGMIDKDLLNSYKGESYNVAVLKILVNSDRIIELKIDDSFVFRGPDGNLKRDALSWFPFEPQFAEENEKDIYGDTPSGTSTGESGMMGITLLPDLDGNWNSPNDNIVVVLHKALSSNAAAEIYSHEMNGHAFLYILNGGNHFGACHQPNDDNQETNTILKWLILRSKKETIYNRQGL